MARWVNSHHSTYTKRRSGKRRTAQTYSYLALSMYRVWMAIRECKIKQWALRLNDGRFNSPETLVWEVAARNELS
eukprot:896897-Heterocapsa_arctica.AAC.1